MAENFESAVKPFQGMNLNDKKYCIVVPEKSDDLVNEGTKLHHCLASYRQKVSERRSMIFFVRDKEKPTESLYTLEVDYKQKMLLQFRGLQNCAPVDEAFDYARRFIESIDQSKIVFDKPFIDNIEQLQDIQIIR